MKTSSIRIKTTDNIKPAFLFKGVVGQDGAIFGDELFRFENNGTCTVYSIVTHARLAEFALDKNDILTPHCNTVCFGAERVSPDDEFPVLYCNVYNNYAKCEDRMEGVCCVYRLMRDGNGFKTQLVQIIRIGFVDDLTLWKSLPDNGDKRPYGNFVPDVTTGKLYAFTMRDKEKVTRYFEFDIPKLCDGVYNEKYGVNQVTLDADAILAQFDCEYSNFIQGGCAYDGILFSLEGGTVKAPEFKNMPKLKVIDTQNRRQLASVDFYGAGLSFETELIDFAGDTIYYMDCAGSVYTLEFC